MVYGSDQFTQQMSDDGVDNQYAQAFEPIIDLPETATATGEESEEVLFNRFVLILLFLYYTFSAAGNSSVFILESKNGLPNIYLFFYIISISLGESVELVRLNSSANQEPQKSEF